MATLAAVPDNEHVTQALFTLEFSGKIAPAWRVMRRCISSEIGCASAAYKDLSHSIHLLDFGVCGDTEQLTWL